MHSNTLVFRVITALSLVTTFAISSGAQAAEVGAGELPARATVQRPTLIGIGNLDLQSELGQQACAVLQAGVSDWSMFTQVVAPCRPLRGAGEIDHFKNNLSPDPKFKSIGTLVLLTDNLTKDTLDLEILNLAPEDSTDPKALTWNIHKGPNALMALKKLLIQYNTFDVDRNKIKKILLQEAPPAALSSRPPLPPEQDFKQAYADYVQSSITNAKYLAAGLEIAAILGFSTASYYAGSELNNPNNEDWDYNAAGSFKGRLNGSGLAYDDNAFRTNRGHMYAGTVYYTIARNAGLNRWESLLVTFASSSFWEYVSEYREVVSINDQINTTLGGFIIGETIFQISKIFNTRANTPTNRILKGIFGSPQKMSTWIDKRTSKGNQRNIFENTDVNYDIWSKLDFSVGMQRSKTGASSTTMAMDGEVIAIPMFEEPGQAREILTDTVFSKLMIENSVYGNDSTFKLFAKSTLAAYYQKQISLNRREQLQGYNLFVGPSTAVEIDQEVQFNNEKSKGSDFRGIVHILGSTIDATIYNNGWKIRCVIDVYADFAMIRSYAFESYRLDHDVTKTISVLQDRDYYYGWGATGSLGLAISKGRISVGGSISRSSVVMIESRARHQTAETVLVHPSDEVTTAKVWVVYELSRSLKIEVGVEAKDRIGRIAGYEDVTGSDIKKYGKLIYSY